MAVSIDVNRAKELITEGDGLLVCAYDDEDKCRSFDIDESITMSELQSELDDLPKSRPLVFFCA